MHLTSLEIYRSSTAKLVINDYYFWQNTNFVLMFAVCERQIVNIASFSIKLKSRAS